MARTRFGIDLGTYAVKVYRSSSDSIRSLKNAVAVRRKKELYATGDTAYAMFERAPSDMEIIFPMARSVISDYNAMQHLLQEVLQPVRNGFFQRSECLLAAPTDVTEVERRAFYNLLMHSEARWRDVMVIDRPLADAIGAGLDIFGMEAAYVINIGAATTELSVLSSGGIVVDRMSRIGGMDLDAAIASYLRREYQFRAGIFAAEECKNVLGSAYGVREETLLIQGRSLLTGLPGELLVNAHEVYTAIHPLIEKIVEESRSMLDRIPPEMVPVVKREGVLLTGGVARLQNMDKLLEMELGIPVRTAEEPELTAALGMKEILNDSSYSSLTYSMASEKHRWIG